VTPGERHAAKGTVGTRGRWFEKDHPMRTHIIAAFLIAYAGAAAAQQVVAPPAVPAPSAAAPLDERAIWCDQYATWLLAMTDATPQVTPPDVRPTQRLEVELNACKLDPQDYERDTRAEADEAVAIAQG
jgi:hypothetical protein